MSAMKPPKLRNLLEFKDRDQVRDLLKIAAHTDNTAEITEILMGYIKNQKWVLLGLVDGPVLKALMGIELLEKKQAYLQFISVRPDAQSQGLGAQILEMATAKQKLKKLSLKSPESTKGFFDKCGFEMVQTGQDLAGNPSYQFEKNFS